MKTLILAGLLSLPLSAAPFVYTATDTRTQLKLSVIDWQTQQVVDEIPLPSHGPVSDGIAAVAANPNGKFVYAADADGDRLFVIEADADTLIATIALPQVAGARPQSLAVTPDGNRVWVVYSDGSIAVVCAIANVVLCHFSLGPNSGLFSSPLVFSPDGKLAYVARQGYYGPSNIAVISVPGERLVQSISTFSGPGATNLAFSPAGQFLYVCNSFGVGVLNVATGLFLYSPAEWFDGYPTPLDVVLAPSGKYGYVSAYGSNIVLSTVNLVTGQVVNKANEPALGTNMGGAYGIQITPNGQYILYRTATGLAFIDTATLSVAGTVDTFTPYGGPFAVLP